MKMSCYFQNIWKPCAGQTGVFFGGTEVTAEGRMKLQIHSAELQ